MLQEQTLSIKLGISDSTHFPFENLNPISIMDSTIWRFPALNWFIKTQNLTESLNGLIEPQKKVRKFSPVQTSRRRLLLKHFSKLSLGLQLELLRRRIQEGVKVENKCHNCVFIFFHFEKVKKPRTNLESVMTSLFVQMIKSESIDLI